ncbi:MAG: PAS domain S-box protein [Rhodocyclaceae bacterium]
MEQAQTAAKSVAEQSASPDPACLNLIEAIGAAIMLHRGAHILYANTALEVLTGFGRDELLAMDFDQIAHPDARDLIRQRGMARLRGEAVVPRYEFRLAAKDGLEHWVEANLALLDLDGMPTVVASLTDMTERKRADAVQRHMQQVLGQIIDGNPVPTLVINERHQITHWNKACAEITGVPAIDLLGTRRQWQPFYPAERPVMADLVVDGVIEAEFGSLYHSKFKRSTVATGAYEAEDFFPHFGTGGRWLFFTAAPLRDAEGRIIGAIETLQDVTERRLAEEKLRKAQAGLEELVERRTQQLAASNKMLAEDIERREATEQELRKRYTEVSELNTRLSEAKQQLVQAEKLASIGQLAAGVAHEINNPIGYVHSNICALEKYLDDVFTLLAAYEADEASETVKALHKAFDIGFLREDIPLLMKESKEGISRVKKIVQDLKDFSHVDSTDQYQLANLHHGIDSTLNIVANEIKYKADVLKEYGDLPDVECLPSQINQVIMNLCVNAAHAMSDNVRGKITIRSGCTGANVWIEIADTGSGIPADVLPKIFDPFFTTKPVGKGTGLGLSLSYGIIQNHNGHLTVKSEVGKGTTFRITLPIKHTEPTNGSTPEPDWSL